ncbi:recombinase family protein [Dyella sp.]|uniref:recombinase family protein n=1 Tax=Dyella sp. TaxID=1869338 RepID=UPI003F80BA59
MKIVSYLRVSTRRQGSSGLGLEAQLAAINEYARQRSASIIETFTEIESGKGTDRPQLQRALHLAKVTGATLVIAKLDRLSRNAAFLLTLRDSGVRFIAADMPDANDLTVGVMALVAQQEREAISKRTREALAAARSRGMRLGNPNGASALRRAGKGNAASLQSIRTAADAHAGDLRPVVRALAADGVTSLGAIAVALNNRGILTPRKRSWHKSSVRNLLLRIGYLDRESMETNPSTTCAGLAID